GVAVWVLGLPAALLIRGAPEKYGTTPDGDAPGATPPARAVEDAQNARSTGQYDYTLGEALRTRAYWLLAMGHSLSIMVISAASVHQFAHMEEGVGLTPQSAAIVVAVLSITNMGGRLVGGIFGDRLSKRHLGAAGMLGTAGSLFIFAFANSFAMAMLYGVLYGFFWGMRGPMIDSLRADYFGRAHFGKIAGTSSLLTMPGSVIGPVFAGLMADTLGDYFLGFIILASVSGAGFFLMLLAGQPPLPPRLRDEQAPAVLRPTTG
ncbi:MAG: MFS transporter, partial [SAR202 cluster bacterium]|nr:MFS transporter [SAR202 cluster bacterium]